jgi:hypothetical protein
MAEKTKPHDQKQAEAFRKAARGLGCDENEDRFKDALRTVAKAMPSDQDHERPRKGHED